MKRATSTAEREPASKRARRMGLMLLLDDVEVDGHADAATCSESDESEDIHTRPSASTGDPLDALLHASLGYPLNEDARSWTPSALKLRRWSCPHNDGVDETVVGGVYWVQAPGGRDGGEWAAEQPWMDNLTCRPHKNSLAPGAPKSFSVAYRHPAKRDWIGLPRFLGLSIFGTPSRDVRSTGEGMSEAVALRAGRPLRDYQLRARSAAIADLEHWGGATIIADCGAGKTAMALSIAASLRRKTLVLCNRSFLMQQWRHDAAGKGWTWADDNSHVSDQAAAPTMWRLRCDACKKVLVVHSEAERQPLCTTDGCGYRHVLPWIGTVAPREGWLDSVRVGWLQGALVDGTSGKPSKTVDIVDKDIVISSIDSVAQCGYPRELLNQFGLVIVDEMHHLGALTLSQVLPQLPARYVLGISATPDRNDGLEHVLYWLAGPTCFVYKRLPSITGVSHTVHVRQLLFRGGVRKEIVYRSGQIGFAAMINSLAADPERNTLLLHLARDALERGRRKVLIVTSIVEHAKGLAAALGGPAAGVMTVYGGCSTAIVAQGKSDAARVVVATYQFLEEGYDDPTLDTLIMALPRSRIQQVVGRCERTHEGKLVPEVLDIVDTFSVFEPMSWKRHRFYKSRGFLVARTDSPSL